MYGVCPGMLMSLNTPCGCALQIIDDTQGNTLAASSSLSPALREVLKEVGGATTVITNRHTLPSHAGGYGIKDFAALPGRGDTGGTRSLSCAHIASILHMLPQSASLSAGAGCLATPFPRSELRTGSVAQTACLWRLEESGPHAKSAGCLVLPGDPATGAYITSKDPWLTAAAVALDQFWGWDVLCGIVPHVSLLRRAQASAVRSSEPLGPAG